MNPKVHLSKIIQIRRQAFAQGSSTYRNFLRKSKWLSSFHEFPLVKESVFNALF